VGQEKREGIIPGQVFMKALEEMVHRGALQGRVARSAAELRTGTSWVSSISIMPSGSPLLFL
jgi:hypothetical protein